MLYGHIEQSIDSLMQQEGLFWTNMAKNRNWELLVEASHNSTISVQRFVLYMAESSYGVM
jgi:hypothetical protein